MYSIENNIKIRMYNREVKKWTMKRALDGLDDLDKTITSIQASGLRGAKTLAAIAGKLKRALVRKDPETINKFRAEFADACKKRLTQSAGNYEKRGSADQNLKDSSDLELSDTES